jgi:hypothetical protein
MMKLLPIAIWLALSLSPVADPAVTAHPHHWTEAEANDWYAKQPWMVGANFIASYASNQMEMCRRKLSTRWNWIANWTGRSRWG